MFIIKMSRFILVVITSIMLVGCSNFAQDEASGRYLEGKVIVDGENYKLIHGYYTYKDEDVEFTKLDSFSPVEAADQFDTLQVGKNAEIEIELDDRAAYVTVHQWNENGEVKEILLDKNVLTVPAEEGYYIYEVVATWQNGETTLVFDIEVE